MSSVVQNVMHVFDICSGFHPYAVRFDHKGSRQHLTVWPAVSRLLACERGSAFPVKCLVM